MNVRRIWQHTAYFLSVFILYFGVALLLNGKQLATWIPNGDDWYLLSSSISSPRELIAALLTQWSGQYRYLTYAVYSVYHYFQPHFATMWIFQSALVALIPTLLFFVLDSRLKLWMRLSLAAPVLLSPIFFYHMYTISSLSNILMCLITLTLLLYWKYQDRLVGIVPDLIFFLVALSSIAIKESFILPIVLYLLIQVSRLRTGQRPPIVYIALIVLACIAYGIMRLTGYSNSSSTEYYFDISLHRALFNSSHWLAWMIGYPMGWQYGAPIRLGIIQPILSLAFVLFFGITLTLGWFINRKPLIVLIGLVGVTFSLFLFLSQTHVFYLDLLFLLFSVFLGSTVARIERKKQWLSSTIVVSWLVLNLVSMLTVKSQWLEYSFVARAQQSAESYLQVLNTNDVEKYQFICILEHNRGQFGTEDGNMINHLKAGTFSIVSTTESVPPPECATDSALILVNDAWEYSVYDKRE